MAILVTGGAGYIGSHCVRKLVEDGHSVVVIDDLTTGHEDAAGGARFYKGSLTDEAFVKNVFDSEDVEAVIHFAASSLVGESCVNPGKYFKNNVLSSVALAEAMVAHNVKYLVFSSTAAVYGEPEKTPITEDDPTNPTNPYGESKLMIERIMGWYRDIFGLSFCPLRYFNVAGAWPDGSLGENHSPETHLIPIVLEAALGKREGVTVFGSDYPTPDGTCLRDYIHVLDLIDAHLLALDYLKNGGESTVFNLGLGRGFSVMEIIEAAGKVTGREIPVTIGERRAGDPSVLVASGDKARTVLGWKPKYTKPETIIEHAWRWHKSV